MDGWMIAFYSGGSPASVTLMQLIPASGWQNGWQNAIGASDKVKPKAFPTSDMLLREPGYASILNKSIKKEGAC